MHSNTLRLDGRVVLVTGASSGIGVRFARQCAAAGAAVVLAARRKERLEALAEELAASSARVLPVVMDVADEDSVMAAFDAAEEAFGPITSIVANAGVTVSGRALDFDITDWDLIYAINVRGVFLTAREGARRMRAAGVADSGRIVLISSITAKMQTSGTVPYSSAKAAVTHMGKLLAKEWARSGPNVNLLSPGYIASDLVGDWFDTEAGHKHLQSWPRGRMLDDNALDETLLYLLSDASRNVTGSDFVIDDGQSL